VVIVSDILSEILGYDKYNEVTREYAIKSTYCDLAIKIENSIKFLIEVKAIGLTLQEKHYQQVLDYGANYGVDWIILTNGLIWRVYKVKFDKPIKTDFICEINITELKLKNDSDVEKLYILCKEGLKKNAIDEFTDHKMTVNRFFISAILQSDSVLDIIKKELRKINSNTKAENEEVLTILKTEILKRELIDAPEAIVAIDKYNKTMKKIAKDKAVAQKVTSETN
jgi:hypothetical protein